MGWGDSEVPCPLEVSSPMRWRYPPPGPAFGATGGLGETAFCNFFLTQFSESPCFTRLARTVGASNVSRSSSNVTASTSECGMLKSRT